MPKLYTTQHSLTVAGLLFFLSLINATAIAQVSMDKSTSFYSQNFNGLPASGTGVWESGANFFPGWTVARTIAGNAIVANTGSSNLGNLYSYGMDGVAERALGSVGTGSKGEYAYGLLLQNNTGEVITEIDISFIGEQWRIGELAALEQKLTFWYAIRSDRNFNLSPASDAGWVAVRNLDFTSPIFGISGSSLNGNLGANRRQLTQTLVVNIPVGHFIMLRWKDVDDTFADHGLAIDDFSLSWRNAPKPSGVLPIELSRFLAKQIDSQVQLLWETASETDNNYFAIERSSDGYSFDELAIVKGRGTTTQVSSYNFTDTHPITGTAFYRLKQVDYSQSFEYSKVVSVHFMNEAAGAIVYPTNATSYLQVELPVGELAQEVKVIDSTGKLVLRANILSPKFTLNVSGLKEGFYTLIITSNTGKAITRKFRKV